MIKAIVVLVFTILLNLTLRITGYVMYPVAYVLRDYMRLDKSSDIKYTMTCRKGFKWLWWYLDDSIYLSHGVDYNSNPAGNGGTTNTGDSFVKAYYWSAWRNSHVNHGNSIAVGRLLEGYPTEPNYIRVGKHELNGVVKERFRMKWIFFKKFKVDIGWTDGTGRYESKIRIV